MPFERRQQLAASTPGWHSRLAGAGSIDAVIAEVKDYLAQWSPSELAKLPDTCRPGRIVDADDITFYALALVREQFHREEEPALARMASFFAAAARRVSQLMTHTHPASMPA